MNLFRTMEAVDDGSYIVGDVMDFTLHDGEEVQAFAVKQEADGMLFVLTDCLAHREVMNSQYNRSGFLASDLCAKLNGTILDRFPAEIRNRMVPFSKGILLRIPTEKEIFGLNCYGKDEGNAVQQWEPMKLRKNRVAFLGKNGVQERYWLDSPVDDVDSLFDCADGFGRTCFQRVSWPAGVRPVFKISSLIPVVGKGVNQT